MRGPENADLSVDGVAEGCGGDDGEGDSGCGDSGRERCECYLRG